MIYYKIINDGYLEGIGTTSGDPANIDDRITEAEYNQIMSVIQACPHEPCKVYKLRTDLTWEVFDAPESETDEPLEDLSTAELKDILTELGISASMTKENMINLIRNSRGLS